MSLNWRGAWASNQTYQVNDVVFYLTASFIALDINTNIAPTQSNIGTKWSYFALGLQGVQGVQGGLGLQGVQGIQGTQGVAGATGASGQGFTWRNAYSTSVSYNSYDCVSYTDGNSYVCIADGIINIPPGLSSPPGPWDILAQGAALETVYSVAGVPLPAATTLLTGTRAFVSDATANTFGAAYTGSGSFKMPVWCNGSNWFIG